MQSSATLTLLGALLVAGCGPDDLPFDGPLANGPGSGIYGFARHGKLETYNSDAIRIIIAPSFGIYHYRFDVVPLKKGCRVIDRTKHFDKQPVSKMCGDATVSAERSINPAWKERDPAAKPLRFAFVIPAPEYTSLFRTLSSKTEKWRGHWQGVTDGTSTAIELHSGGKIVSYHSNVPLEIAPDNPAAFASLQIRAIALAYAPTGSIPRGIDWNVDGPNEEIQPKFR